MTPDERRKAIDTAVAEATNNALLPTSIKVGLAAMAEELRDLGARLRRVEPLELRDPEGATSG